MRDDVEELTFEEAVSRLEEIVDALETGNLPLDQCLARFQVAVALSRHCAATLEAAEAQIRLLDPDGSLRSGHELAWAAELQADGEE